MKGTVGMIALGCPKNRLDSENILYLLKQAGWAFTAEPAQADVLIVNTCGFIQSAKEEAIEAIWEMAEVKEQTGCKLVVAGCLAQRYPEALLEEIPQIDALVGVTQYDRIVEIIESLNSEPQAHIGDIDRAMPPCGRELITEPWTAYLKIAEGCDNRCSYCAIPSIRGRYRSRPMLEILDEARELARQGVQELVLVAQDTTRYGVDQAGTPQLVPLLDALCAIDGFAWIRILYAYPEMVDDALIDCIGRQEKICPYLDVPIQHINTEVLCRMNRRSDRAQIERMIARARSCARPIVLRTTVICGFPGEQKAQFDELRAFVAQGHFARLGAFAFSQEDGTVAAEMGDQLPARTKKARERSVLQAQQAVSLAFNKGRIGTVEHVLIEHKESAHTYHGRSRYEAPEIDGKVIVHSEDELMLGAFYQVRIDHATEYDIEGRVCT